RCEIEATLERLKKLERDLSFKEQELKERERRLRMWEQKLTEQSNTPLLPSFDICAWTEEDVFFWMQQLTRKGDASGEMIVYASLFKEHHITGKRLLLLEEEDLKDMGIVSRGHIIHLKTAIEKLTHDYLNLFHFPPLIKASGAEENIEKVVNLELVFGYHLKPGNGPKDCKWKMYMEMDGDEIAITYIKDVTFNTNLPDVEILKMTKPPFVMEKWIVGIEEHQSVEYIVTYESDVRAPKTTRHIQAVCWSKVKAQDEVETVQLMIQTSLPNSEGNSRSRSDSGIDSQWMQTLRMHQISKAISLQHGHPHSPTTVTHYLRMRVPTRYQFMSISHSRNCSSLSQSVTRNLSNLHLNSKGSSTSSTASDTPSERDRSAGKGRNTPHSGNSCSSSDGRRGGTSPLVPPRHLGGGYRTSAGAQHRRHPRGTPQPKAIPGMPPQGESEPGSGDGESRASEGGWIKVQYVKKPHRQTIGKPGKERPRGSWRGRRTF
ncbi:Mitogen-activated protein kinase kinase kinase MLT, partial [Merops nubicus]